MKQYDPDAVVDEWVTKELCLDCGDYYDHTYIEFRDEPVVESECTACGATRVYEDERD